MPMTQGVRPVTIERVQTGVRIEKRILKVMKALAEYLDISLGDLLEGIALHVFEGKAPFSTPTLAQIAALKKVYGLELTARHSHHLVERASPAKSAALKSCTPRARRKGKR